MPKARTAGGEYAAITDKRYSFPPHQLSCIGADAVDTTLKGFASGAFFKELDVTVPPSPPTAPAAAAYVPPPYQPPPMVVTGAVPALFCFFIVEAHVRFAACWSFQCCSRYTRSSNPVVFGRESMASSVR